LWFLLGFFGGLEGGGEEAGDAYAGGEPADVAGVTGLGEERGEFFVGGEAFGFQELEKSGGLGIERFEGGEDFGEDVLDDLFVHILFFLVRTSSAWFFKPLCSFQTVWLGGELAAEFLDFAGEFGFAEIELFDGNAGFPGLFDAH